jgi:Flp pilus assembly protein TadG
MKLPGDPHEQSMTSLHGMSRGAVTERVSIPVRPIGGRFRACLRSGDEGQSIVEFAFVLPLMVLLVMGLFGLGLFIAYYQALTQATGEAAQTLAKSRAITADPCATTLTALEAASPLHLNPSSITLTVQFAPLNSTTFTTLGGNSCPTTASSSLGGTTSGGTVIVGVSYIYSCHLPFSSVVCQPITSQVTEYVY